MPQKIIADQELLFSILVLEHDNHVLVQIDIRGDTKASCFHFKRFMWVAKLMQTFNSIENNIFKHCRTLLAP